MKKLIFIAALFISAASFGQGNWTLSGAKNRWANGMGFGNKDTSTYTNASDTNLLVLQHPGVLVYRHLLTDHWEILSYNSTVSNYKLISDSLFNAGYTRRDRTKQGLDSLGGLKLNISDTASMLANRLKISDTATMLNPYPRIFGRKISNFWYNKTWEVDGNSITYGVDATSFDSSYVGRVANHYEISYIDSALGGSIVRNVIYRQFKNSSVVSPNTNFSVSIGINDIRNSTVNTIQGVYEGLKAVIANRFLDTIQAASTMSQTGTWSTLTATNNISSKSLLKALGNPLKSTASGSTLTTIITTNGRTSLVIGTWVDTGSNNLGQFSVTIDGNLYGTFNPSNKANAYYYSVLSPAFDWRQPAVYILSGLSSGTHTVVITTISNSEVDIDYIGRMAAPESVNGVLVGHVLKMRGYNSDGIALQATAVRVDSINNKIDSLIGEFNNIGYYSIGQVFSENFVTTNNMPDSLHPNNAGHLQIANAFIDRINTLGNGNIYYGRLGITVDQYKGIGIGDSLYVQSVIGNGNFNNIGKYKSTVTLSNSVSPAFEIEASDASTDYFWQLNGIGDLILRNSPSTKDSLISIQKTTGNLTSYGNGNFKDLLRVSGTEPQLSIFQSSIKEWTIKNPLATTRLGIFEENTTERMSFVAGGKIGVGTTDPRKSFDVSDTLAVGNIFAPSLAIGNSTDTVITVLNNNFRKTPNAFVKYSDTAALLATQTIDRVLNNGNSSGRSVTLGDVTVTNTSSYSKLNRLATSNNALLGYQTNGTTDWWTGTGLSGSNSNYHIYNNSLGNDAFLIDYSNDNITATSSITALRIIGASGTDNSIDAIQSGGGSILGNLYRSEGKIQATSTTIDATATVWIDNTNGSTVTYTLPTTSSLQGGNFMFLKSGTGTLTLSGTIIDKTGTSQTSIAVTSASGLIKFWFNGTTWYQVN